jgi:hypothetical protein
VKQEVDGGKYLRLKYGYLTVAHKSLNKGTAVLINELGAAHYSLRNKDRLGESHKLPSKATRQRDIGGQFDAHNPLDKRRRITVSVFSKPVTKWSEIFEFNHSTRISSISFSKSFSKLSRLSIGKDFIKQISKQRIAKFSPFSSLSFAKAFCKVSKVALPCESGMLAR